MARGRHVRRSGFVLRLRRVWPSRRVRWTRQEQALIGLRADLHLLESEVARLRVLGARHAASAAAADLRARRAEEQLAAARDELAGLRGDLAALREELVWAFAERKVPIDAPATVIDLRAGTATTA